MARVKYINLHDDTPGQHNPGDISEVLCQKQLSRAGTSNYIPQILWDVITCPCPWYPRFSQNTPKWHPICRRDGKTLVCNTLNPLVLKFGQFAMHEACENWLGLVNICIYYSRQTREIYQVLPFAVDFKVSRESDSI